MKLDPTDREAIAYLRSPQAIRERCEQLFELACADRLRYFRSNLSQLTATADYVIQVIRENYPNLDIPFHSRWRHFEVGDVPRLAQLEEKLADLTPLEKAWAKFDLAIISVLLDAGAGSQWQYQEPETGKVFRRSEGLAVASFHLFCQGLFSNDPANPLQVDAIALQKLSTDQLAQGFQASQTNPLVAMQGRAELLQRLGQTLQLHPKYFGLQNPRPGYLVNYLLDQTVQGQLTASTVLQAVLEGLGNIWSGRITLAGVNLGDVWPHPALSPQTTSPHSPLPTPYPTLIPFHKLSQWLTYSLLEPLQEIGVEIIELDALTGLPEYRNGGLCLDLGLLQVKDPTILQKAHLPGSEAIVEWRALTVTLLDKIAETIRQQLNLTATQLPLVKILQGGTWTAGRKIAAERRPGGIPPIQIESDGTVF
ncbi:URC4/urg3 family protein [Leptothermofonsia sp. ETS-13]|uniref:URC4/urg3 family protein n=1 Tax=Leptothermofonsia sp. ETS-13 TaxID=3035696 RepID=UPI003BA20C2F